MLAALCKDAGLTQVAQEVEEKIIRMVGEVKRVSGMTGPRFTGGS